MPNSTTKTLIAAIFPIFPPFLIDLTSPGYKQLLIFEGRFGMKEIRVYDGKQKYYDNSLSLSLLNIILTQTQLILQGFFPNFTILFTLHSYRPGQISRYSVKNSVSLCPHRIVPVKTGAGIRI